jgi:hypothetical protein
MALRIPNKIQSSILVGVAATKTMTTIIMNINPQIVNAEEVLTSSALCALGQRLLRC